LVQLTVRQGTITIHAAAQVNESHPVYTPTQAEAAAVRRGRAPTSAETTSPSSSFTMSWTLLVTRPARKSLAKLPEKTNATSCKHLTRWRRILSAGISRALHSALAALRGIEKISHRGTGNTENCTGEFDRFEPPLSVYSVAL
jgi:hypothetical protein